MVGIDSVDRQLERSSGKEQLLFLAATQELNLGQLA